MSDTNNNTTTTLDERSMSIQNFNDTSESEKTCTDSNKFDESADKAVDREQSETERDSEEVSIIESLAQMHIEPLLNRNKKNGQTPIMVACVGGCLPVVRHLALASDVNINTRDSEGNTALILAAHAGHTDVIRFLLWTYENIEVDAENNFGMTALMKTALRGHTLCARILIVAGADIAKRDSSRNYCAHEWAMLCGFKQTAKAIKNVGSAGPLHIERQTTRNTTKQKSFSIARSAYSSVKKRINTSLFGRRDGWIDDVGALYYLVESTAQPANVVWPLAWDKLERRSLSVGENLTGYGSQDPKVEIRSPRKARENFSHSQGNLGASSKRRHSRRYGSDELPTILYVASSPVPKRKAKVKESKDQETKDDNLLQVPSRKAKSVSKS